MTQARVRSGLDGVRKLLQKDNRLEGTVALESMKYDVETNRATPTLRIEEGPQIRVNVIGAKVSQSTLRRLIPIFEEHAVDRDLLVEGARNLRDYFQSDGFFDAQVEFKQQRISNDKAAVDFLVNTGKRHKLVAIRIKGNHYFSTDVIRERMYLQKANFLQFPHGRYSENLLRRDRTTISNLYEANGFRDVKVTSTSVDNYLGVPGNLAVTIDIQEGPQYLINRLQLEGVEKLNGGASSPNSAPPTDSRSASSTWRWIAIRSWRNISIQGFANATFEWSSKPAGRAPAGSALRGPRGAAAVCPAGADQPGGSRSRGRPWWRAN